MAAVHARRLASGAALAAFAHRMSSGPAAQSEHSDARFFREQHEHRALGLSLAEEAKGGWWHEVTRRSRDGEAINAADAHGATALHYAARAGKRRLVEELIALGARCSADEAGRGPLGWAAAAGHASVVSTLLGMGAADVNEADRHGATALHLAAQQGHLALARALLSRRELLPCAADRFGVAPLHKAVSFGHVSLVVALLGDKRVQVDQRVGEVDAPDSFEAISGGETALGLAAGHTYHFHHTNHTRTARLLLDAGADPNARCGAGNTAAHRAAAAGNAGVVRELLARGARVDWKAWDAKGRTAEQVAREAGHAGVAEMIAGR